MTEQPNYPQSGYSGTRNGEPYTPPTYIDRSQPAETPFPQQTREQQIDTYRQWDAQVPPGYQRIWWKRDPQNQKVIYWKPDAQYRYRPDLPPAIWDSTKQFQGYWDDPKNVVKAYNYLRVQDDDFEPPAYLDKDFVNSMYKTLASYNGNQDPALWKPLPYGTEESYYAYAAPGPDWWESMPGNRYKLPDNNPQRVTVPGQTGFGTGLTGTLSTGVTASLEAVQAIIDEVNAEQLIKLQEGQISQDEYDQSVQFFSQYALSDEGRAFIGQNMTEEQLAAPFDPRDYSQLAVTGLLEQQGVLDLNGEPFQEYTEMEPFAQILLTLFGSPENLNAPEYSRQISAGVQGGMAGFGAWGAVMTYGVIAAKVAAGPAAAVAATGVGAPVAAAIPIVAFALAGLVGGLQYHSAITGKQNFISTAFNKVMNFLSQGTEQVIGTATIMSEINKTADELIKAGATEEQVSKTMYDKYGITSQDFWEKFGSAWTASRMYYESAGGKGAGDWIVDTVSTTLHAINPKLSSGMTTAPGEVWQLQLGRDTPSALGLNSVETRAAIMRDLNALGPNPDRQSKEAVLAMWQDALGMTGNMNDFVGQMFVDPLNFAPGAVNKGLDLYAQKQFKAAVAANDLPTAKWYANLSEAAKLAPGNPIIDSLPFGVQNVAEMLIRTVARTPKGGVAPKWLRGTINPVATWNYASGAYGAGYMPKMMVDLMNDMQARGYPAPVGSTIDISGGTPGMVPTVKVFVSSDRMHAQFNLIGTDGSIIGRQFISSDGNLPFVDTNDIIKQFKEMVSTDNYKAQFPNDGFSNALMGDLQVAHSGSITYLDYIKTYMDEIKQPAGGERGAPTPNGEVFDNMLNAIGKPVIVDAKTGAVIADGRLMVDSVTEDGTSYRVTSVDGKTEYTVNAGNDEVINMKVDGQDVLLPEDGLIIAPYKVSELTDPGMSRINVKAVNDFAAALGVEKPYPSEIDLVGAKPTAGAEPTKLTGNRITDYFLKMNDYTPESKIAITNKAIVETILGVMMMSKNDPDKFFAFFDYLAGRNVDVSRPMKEFAAGKVVATAMLTLKAALKEGGQFYMLRDAWQNSTIRRVEVTNFARMLGVAPEKLVTMKPDDIFKKLTAYNTKAAKTDPTKVLDMTVGEIKKFIAPYVGPDALPLTKQELVNKAQFAFVSDAEKAAIQLFDPQVKPGLTQFSNMLKAIIGLPLISANPATWMMNAFNNWVTMNLFVGAGGLSITGKAMRDSIARFGADYTLLAGNEFKVSEVEMHTSKELQEILNPDNWMTGVKRFVTKLSSTEVSPLDSLARAAKVTPESLVGMTPDAIVKAIKNSSNKKIANLSPAQVERMITPYVGENAKPLTRTRFNPLATYGKIEQFFAMRTMKIAIDKFMGSTPLSDISPEIRTGLEGIGLTERQIKAFQQSGNRAYNMDEINAFFKDGEINYNPVPDEIIGAALDKLSGGDPEQRAAIDTLLDFNGLRDDLTEMLKKPRTPEELDAIQMDLIDKLTEVADQTRANNLAAEFAKVTEDTSGHIGLLKNLYMVAQQEYQTLYNANRQFGVFWDSVDQASKTMSTPEFRAYKASMWEVTSGVVNKMWDSTYKVMLNAVTAGMQKVGLGEDGDFFVNNLAERLTLMRKVYADIQKTNTDANDGIVKTADVGKLLDRIYSDYAKARDANQKAWVDKIIELYDKNGVPLSGMTKEQMHARMVGYMGEFLKRDRTFRNNILNQRRAIESLPYEAKRAANKTFYENTYQADSLEMLKFLTNEAYENFNTKRPAKHTSKGTGQTEATKPKATTPAEAAVENKRAIFNRNQTALERSRMMNDQAKAAYGQYNRQMFHAEIQAATNLTDMQRSASIAYFDAFDATVKRLSNNEFGFYDRVGSIDAFESDYLPQDRFVSPSGERYIAAMTYGEDGKFILNFATELADEVSLWHEGSHAIVDTARRLYDMGVFEGYKVMLEEAGKTTIEAFDAMDMAAKGKVMDDIADSMFKWQSDAEVAKSMPTGLKAAFTTMSQFLTDLVNRLFKRYKDIEVSTALKEVYRSLFVNNDVSAKADRNATRIAQYREGASFKIYGAQSDTQFEVVPVVVEAELIQPSHDLGGFKNQDFPQELQPREYNLDFVRQKASDLKPELLLTKPLDLSNGAPIIDQYGNVIAGNHRMGFLTEARESFPNKWTLYQQKLIENLGQYGLTEADLKDINNPVLVYRVVNGDDVAKIVNDANAPTQQVMSPFEYANRNAGFLRDDLIAKLNFGENKTVDDVLASAAAADLRAEFINNLYDSERGQYLVKGTRLLNDSGKEAFKNALTAKVYGGSPDGQMMLKTIVEDGSDFSKVLVNAMTEAVPAMARVNALIDAGKLDSSYAVGDMIATAVIEYTVWRATDPDIRLPLAESGADLFRNLSPEVIKMEQFFDNNITNGRRIANLFNLYAEEVVKIGSANTTDTALPGFELEPIAVKSADELLNSLLDTVNAETQAAVTVDMNNQTIAQLTNNTISGWDAKLRNYIEPVLKQFQEDVKKPTIPPAWANVEGIYDGKTSSYTKIRKTLKEILSGTPLSESSNPEMRNLILTQAHNKLLAESYGYRVITGVEGTPAADTYAVKNAIGNLSTAGSAEGSPLDIFNAVADPLKSALTLLDELKARNADAKAIADLEAAIAAAPVKPLGDGDIAEGDQGSFFQPDELTYQPGSDPLPPVTPDPPQGPLSINQSSAIDQLTHNEISNLVGEITDGLKGYMRDNATFDMEKGLPPEALPLLQKQAAIWENELDIKKLSAMDYAKLTRDHTLLDYTQRRGIDQMLQHVFPYHFWYTSSVTEWAKHMVGDPTVGSAYAKYQELRRKNGMLGFPSRQAGSVWMPAPWLPDYLGNEIFSKPFSRLMPLESILQPISLFTDLSSDMTAATVRIINQMVREQVISTEQGAAAIQNQSDAIWQDAMAQAIQEDESALSDTMTLASQLMGVAPWWQYAYYFATDQKEKISVLPPTRLGQALSSFRGSTWAGDMVAVIGNIIKYPEEKTRELLDMSAYGEPGDYYIRLMLTSMLGDGTLTDVDDVEKQMIERSGKDWEEAKRRADVYLSARLPGSLFLHTVNEFAQNPTPENASGIPQAFFLTMFPAGMIPEGEQHMRDIAPEYQQAWREYNMGNKDALNEFEDKYPEYRVRRNMFKDNDTLLKGFLVDQIWDKWTSIPNASRQLATSSLGDTFETAFLEAKAYDRISNETLAAWSLRLGGLVPNVEQTNLSNLDYAPVPRYNAQVEGAVTAFQDERAQRFPNFYWQQQIYWDTPKEDRDALKRVMPDYFKYLDWKNNYYDTNPLVKQWADDVASRSTGYDSDLLMENQSDAANQAIAEGSVLFEFDDALKAELGKYIVNGTKLSSGALAELNRLWVAKGKPGNSMQQWLDAVLGLRR